MIIIVHCSDAPNGRNDAAADVHRWHQERGFDGIGYHYFIRVDGTIEAGRPHYWKGAHCRGHNDKIGICLAGRDKFTQKQEDALKLLALTLCDDIDSLSMRGHYEFDDKKTCPNFDVFMWLHGKEPWPLLEE